MQWILTWHGEDGPTRELMRQVDFRAHFPDASQVSDPSTLAEILATQSGPVAVFLIAPQDSAHWGWPQGSERLRNQVVDLCQRADAVVLVITEIDLLREHHLREFTQIHNLWIMAPAQHNYGSRHRPFMLWQQWIQDLRDTWQQGDTRQRLQQIYSVTPRPYLFDVLLGGERPYRTQVHDLIDSHGEVRDRVVMTYYGVATASPRFLPEPDMPDWHYTADMHTGTRIRYRGTDMRLACVPPVSIYQQTLITVLAETSAHSVMNFYTEKVAKPLLAGRPFLVIGGQHYLRGLRYSGFRTFSPFIDESYDLEPNDVARVNLVFREMQRLCGQHPEMLLQQLRHQIEHNLDLAWRRDFAASAVFNVRRLAERHWKFYTALRK